MTTHHSPAHAGPPTPAAAGRSSSDRPVFAAPSTERRRVVLLGATGSVGTQALEVIERHPERFEVVGLAAGGTRPDVLLAQAARHPGARLAVSSDPTGRLSDGRAGTLVGPDAACDLIEAVDADVVLNGITGSIGLAPTLTALRTGRMLALANKESLVAGGPLVLDAAAPGQITPVDSEHSALAQALRGGAPREVARLVVTASGGPFRGRSAAQMADVTVADALAHPTWAMGPVVTINSATLVNKGLEVIEAHLLFGIPYDRIDVTVHPQSIVHSMVTFVDGATIAQASPPSMLIPIALALAWPDRLPDVAPACAFDRPESWTFAPVDHEAFPSLRLAYAAGRAGGTVPAAFNAANEEAVDAFRRTHLDFAGIPHVLASILDEADDRRGNPRDLADVRDTEDWARARAREIIAGRRTPITVGASAVGSTPGVAR